MSQLRYKPSEDLRFNVDTPKGLQEFKDAWEGVWHGKNPGAEYTYRVTLETLKYRYPRLLEAQPGDRIVEGCHVFRVDDWLVVWLERTSTSPAAAVMAAAHDTPTGNHIFLL